MKPELLLPAGDPTKLRYAIAYGADAVFLGLPMASLRTPSKGEQFTPSNLGEYIDYCHQHNVKAYVTLNIFANNRDLDRVIPHLEQLESLKPDALIISDPGIFRLAQKYAPSVDLHISTQANILNTSACAFWQDIGATRIILAREVPLREIAEIHEQLPDLELECFVHGSLCVAYSGRCVISDYLTDNTKNSNKGMCGNSCRWEFNVVESNRPDEVYTMQEDEKGSYLLNSKDLCLIKHIQELKEAGICSFKVEGRTKGVHYVSTVGKVYREAIDYYEAHETAPPELVARWEQELRDSANRGFTKGFLHGKPTNEAYSYENSQNRAEALFIASCNGETNADGLVRIQGRNSFDIPSRVDWMTPEGTFEVEIAKAFTDHDTQVQTLNPNQKAWVKPPSQVSPNALQWSLIRQKESSFVAC